jgi:hypothetical protein
MSGCRRLRRDMESLAMRRDLAMSGPMDTGIGAVEIGFGLEEDGGTHRERARYGWLPDGNRMATATVSFGATGAGKLVQSKSPPLPVT